MHDNEKVENDVFDRNLSDELLFSPPDFSSLGGGTTRDPSRGACANRPWGRDIESTKERAKGTAATRQSG